MRDQRRFGKLDKSDWSDRSDTSDESDRSDVLGISHATPEVAANTMICVINQASFLLGRQLRKLEESFLEEGGFTERLYRERTARRQEQSKYRDPSDGSDTSDTTDV